MNAWANRTSSCIGRLRALAAFLLLFGATPATFAQQAFAGDWQVVKVEDAPWLAGRPELKPTAEPAFAHARISFQPDRVSGPAWFHCKKPKYEMMMLDFDSLFEGGLSDPEHGMSDPAKSARRLGFKSEPVTSMLTGCSELLFHLVDADTAMFGLNNMLYTMRRQHAVK
jgi:hypothetical protein